MPDTGTALARLPRFILKQASERGLDRESLLVDAGFTEEDLDDPDARVGSGKTLKLWTALLDGVDDVDLGIRLGQQMSADTAGLVGYVMMHSKTLGDALTALARYGRILSEDYPPEIRIGAEQAEFAIDPIPEERARLWRLADYDLAAVLTIARELVGQEIDPIEAHFPYLKPPEDLTAHQAFFRCPLKFEQPRIKLVFARHQMSTPIHEADRELGRYLEQHAETVIATLAPKGTTMQKVERALWARVSDGRPSLEGVASAMAISPRTLQRRLREEGTSFSKVLDGFRHEMATDLLSDGKLAVFEIAYLLGYSDPSTFDRAFRRWTGRSPGEFRKNA